MKKTNVAKMIRGGKTVESIIKRQVRDYLARKGWFIFPVLQGLGAYKGITDFIACKNGWTLFLEIKTPAGKQSEHQLEFERRILKAGGRYMVIRDIDDLIKKGF